MIENKFQNLLCYKLEYLRLDQICYGTKSQAEEERRKNNECDHELCSADRENVKKVGPGKIGLGKQHLLFCSTFLVESRWHFLILFLILFFDSLIAYFVELQEYASAIGWKIKFSSELGIKLSILVSSGPYGSLLAKLQNKARFLAFLPFFPIFQDKVDWNSTEK